MRSKTVYDPKVHITVKEAKKQYGKKENAVRWQIKRHKVPKLGETTGDTPGTPVHFYDRSVINKVLSGIRKYKTKKKKVTTFEIETPLARPSKLDAILQAAAKEILLERLGF